MVYNPDGRFDHYELNGEAHDSTGENFTVEEILSCGTHLSLPSSLVTPDGIWHDSGTMSYWRMLDAFPGHSVILLDAHL